jgi:hypothetical protein
VPIASYPLEDLFALDLGQEPYFAAALAAMNEWCRENRHKSIREQHAHLCAMMRGHYAYVGITGTARDCAGTPTKSSASGGRC